MRRRVEEAEEGGAGACSCSPSCGSTKSGRQPPAPPIEIISEIFGVLGTRDEVLACLRLQAAWRRTLEKKRKRGKQNAMRTMKRINSAGSLGKGLGKTVSLTVSASTSKITTMAQKEQEMARQKEVSSSDLSGHVE